MAFQTKNLSSEEIQELFNLNKSHFIDLKSAKISPVLHVTIFKTQ